MPHSTFFIEEARGHENIQKLEGFLLELAGVERVLIDTDDGEIKVEYIQETIDLQEIASSLEENGFHIVQ